MLYLYIKYKFISINKMGVWKGWYEQNGNKHEMRLKKFKVKGNKIQGKGKDEVGEFEFMGFYTQDKNVQFVK